MRLLLDTHVWIWSQIEPRRLTPRVVRALEAPTAELWLSPVSVWEAILLADAGKVRLAPDPITWARSALAPPIREAPFTHQIALESRRLGLAHDDPADCFIVASAKILGLTLVTADQRLLKSKQVPVVSAR